MPRTAGNTSFTPHDTQQGTLILLTGKPKLREVKQLARGHSARECQGQELKLLLGDLGVQALNHWDYLSNIFS